MKIGLHIRWAEPSRRPQLWINVGNFHTDEPYPIIVYPDGLIEIAFKSSRFKICRIHNHKSMKVSLVMMSLLEPGNVFFAGYL